MAQEPKTPAQPAQDEVEKFLSEQRAVETHRQELIKELLRQKEAANKEFDEKLAKLGYAGNNTRGSKRSHHKHEAEKKAE